MRSIEPQDSALTYARILDALPIVAFLARPDGTISYFSRGWTDLTGIEASDALGDRYPSIIHPEHRERAVATWLAAHAAGTTYQDELLIRFGDGSYRWILSQANPMRDPDTDRVLGWFGTVTDIDERRRAGETIRAQAEFNERLIDSSDDCINILDLDARLVSMSTNGQRNLQIADIQALVGTSWLLFWKGEDKLAAGAAVATALRGGIGRFTGYYPVAGEPRWFDVVVTPILDALGKPEKLLAVSRDITVQRSTLEALAESERRYRAFGEALPGVAWSASPKGELDFVSERWKETRGRELESVLAYRWLDGLHPDDREAARERWHRSVTTGEPYDTQFRVRMAGGAYRWQLVRALPIRSDAGAITRWIGVNIDIDDQRRADHARDMFVALTENSSDFIGFGDSDGTMRYVNEAGRKLLDIGSLEDAQAAHLFDYFCPADRDYVKNHIVPTVEREGQWTGDFQFRNFRTGAPMPVAYNLFRLVDRSGAVTGIATVSRDRRRRRRIEAGLRLLSRTGAASLDSLDAAATLRNVVQAFVPDFASLCVIDVVTPEREWSRTVVHPDETKAHLIRGLSAPSGRNPVILAVEEGRSTLVNGDAWLDGDAERTEAVRALDLGSFITVPVALPAGQIVGGLTCARETNDPAGGYDEDDVTFVQEAARRAGAAIANVRLYERERRIAVELQAASLPATLPRVGALCVTAAYQPGSDEATIGGDWYDAFVLEDGRVVMTLGDVLGHGLRAAVTMTKLRQAMQAAAMVDSAPNVMLRVADKTLRLHDPDGYATAVAALYDPEAMTLRFASAGHPGPIVRDCDGIVREYKSHGSMLGLRNGSDAEVVVIPTPPGCSVVFFTDGLVEATRDLEAGYERLREAIASDDVISADQPARAIVSHCLGDVVASDDIAVLVARIETAK